MKTPLRFALLLTICACTFASAADSPAPESLDTQITALKQAVTAFAKTTGTRTDRPDRSPESLNYTLANLSTSLGSPTYGNTQELERSVALLVQYTQNDPDVRKAADAVLTTLKTERQARLDRSRSDMETLLKKVGDACLAAKTPEDLDATITLLASYSRNSNYERRNDDPESTQRGANAYRFVVRWQDYLDALRQAKTTDAANIIRDLTNSLDVGLMPRSRLIALTPSADKNASSSSDGSSQAAALKEANNAVLVSSIPQIEQAKTSDQLVAVIQFINSRTRGNPYQYQNPPAVIQVLTNLIDDRQQALSGLRNNLLLSDNNSSSGSNRQLTPTDPTYTPAAQASLTAFRRETKLIVIRKEFPEAKLPAVTTDESPEAYLLRVIEKSADAGNWLQVRDALDLYRGFFTITRTPAWLTSDIDGCNAYLAARNLDTAGQFPAAVTSYQRALRSTGRFVPVKAIGTRLAELKKTNPEAFSSDTSEPVTDTPATPRVLREFPPGLQPNQPPGSGPSYPSGSLRPPAPTGPATP